MLAGKMYAVVILTMVLAIALFFQCDTLSLTEDTFASHVVFVFLAERLMTTELSQIPEV